MGPDAGKQAFGGLQWKHFVSMARDGGLWADIVEIGYSGVEGNVDAEVVANLYGQRRSTLHIFFS